MVLIKGINSIHNDFNKIICLIGLVGCMREINVNGQRIEPRYVINTERVVGEVALDNCQFVDPCTRPNTCEHGGKCSVKEDRITCDCTDTGYVGKNCHFGKINKLKNLNLWTFNFKPFN